MQLTFPIVAFETGGVASLFTIPTIQEKQPFENETSELAFCTLINKSVKRIFMKKTTRHWHLRREGALSMPLFSLLRGTRLKQASTTISIKVIDLQRS